MLFAMGPNGLIKYDEQKMWAFDKRVRAAIEAAPVGVLPEWLVAIAAGCGWLDYNIMDSRIVGGTVRVWIDSFVRQGGEYSRRECAVSIAEEMSRRGMLREEHLAELIASTPAAV